MSETQSDPQTRARLALRELDGVRLDGLAPSGDAPDRTWIASLELTAEAGGTELDRAREALEAALDAPVTILQTAATTPQRPNRAAGLRDVRQILAVASGKGGVGKSTVAANLAFAARRCGLAVGLLDADVYGPSVPRLVGQADPTAPRGDRPFLIDGLAVMSMGFLVAQDQALIWRGPMATGAIRQMIEKINWGRLDLLIVDLPPGTGDVPLTVAQNIIPDAAVVIATPQGMALDDVARATSMLARLEIPLLGLVESMATIRCPECGFVHQLFPSAPPPRIAKLASITFDPALARASDDGKPLDADHPVARLFDELLARVIDQLRRV